MSQFRRITIKCLLFHQPKSLAGRISAGRGQGPTVPYKRLCDSYRRDAYLAIQSVLPCTGWAAGGRGSNPGVLLGWVWKNGRPG